MHHYTNLDCIAHYIPRLDDTATTTYVTNIDQNILMWYMTIFTAFCKIYSHYF